MRTNKLKQRQQCKSFLLIKIAMDGAAAILKYTTETGVPAFHLIGQVSMRGNVVQATNAKLFRTDCPKLDKRRVKRFSKQTGKVYKL